MASCERRERIRLGYRLGRPEPNVIWQIGNFFGEQRTFRWRDEDGVGEDIVHRLQTGAGRLSPRRNLNRRWFVCEHRKPMMFHVPDQIDKYVDAVRADHG
jgi:hypothetical protein